MAVAKWQHLMGRGRGEAGTLAAPVSYHVEQHHAFARGLVEVRRYLWLQPVDEVTQGLNDVLVLNMALTSRPEQTTVDRIEAASGLPGNHAGRLLVMMPGAHYRLHAPSGTFRSLHCALDCRAFDEILGEPVDWASLSELGGVLRPGTEIERLLTRLVHELGQERIGREVAIEAYAAALCVELARRFRQGRPARPDVHTGGLATWRLKLLHERIHADRPAPRVSELADLCGLTTRQLSRAFKAETGMTIGRFIDEATIERAHRMLTGSDMGLAEIAARLGFASPDSFAQSYRRITQMLPSQARRG